MSRLVGVGQGHLLQEDIMDRPSEVTVSSRIINIQYLLILLFQLSVRTILGHMTVVTLATMMTVEEVAAGVGVTTIIVAVVADATMTATEIMTVETVIAVVTVGIGMRTGGTECVVQLSLVATKQLWMWTRSLYDLSSLSQ